MTASTCPVLTEAAPGPGTRSSTFHPNISFRGPQVLWMRPARYRDGAARHGTRRPFGSASGPVSGCEHGHMNWPRGSAVMAPADGQFLRE
jgi:hypothetical protein